MADANPLFVVGASRSGTTLLARMLGQHPDLAYLRESQFFDDLYPVRRLDDTIAVRTAQKVAQRLVDRTSVQPVDRAQLLAEFRTLFASSNLTAAQTYDKTMSWLASRSGKHTYIEQTPRNVYYLQELRRHFPEAFFICLVRDPRGVVASQKRRWRQRSLGAHKISSWETLRLWANYHPYTACHLWNKAADHILASRDESQLGLVRYEDLVISPEACLRPVLSRAGYSFLPEMLDVPLWGSSHVAHSSSPGVSSELVAQWRQVLSATEQHIVVERCRAKMTALGYNETDTPTSKTTGVHAATYPLHCLAVAALNPRRAWIQVRSLASRPVRE
jgi:hypothetical protein